VFLDSFSMYLDSFCSECDMHPCLYSSIAFIVCTMYRVRGLLSVLCIVFGVYCLYYVSCLGFIVCTMYRVWGLLSVLCIVFGVYCLNYVSCLGFIV
jgi:hypothetical protein